MAALVVFMKEAQTFREVPIMICIRGERPLGRFCLLIRHSCVLNRNESEFFKDCFLNCGKIRRKCVLITCLGLQSDLMAGMSVAALVIPQGMSYAKLAGLPSVFGLYGAFVPVLCYAALGSSRHLVGSVCTASFCFEFFPSACP